jgi:hypothetical protein
MSAVKKELPERVSSAPGKGNCLHWRPPAQVLAARGHYSRSRLRFLRPSTFYECAIELTCPRARPQFRPIRLIHGDRTVVNDRELICPIVCVVQVAFGRYSSITLQLPDSVFDPHRSIHPWVATARWQDCRTPPMPARGADSSAGPVPRRLCQPALRLAPQRSSLPIVGEIDRPVG